MTCTPLGKLKLALVRASSGMMFGSATLSRQKRSGPAVTGPTAGQTIDAPGGGGLPEWQSNVSVLPITTASPRTSTSLRAARSAQAGEAVAPATIAAAAAAISAPLQ